MEVVMTSLLVAGIVACAVEHYRYAASGKWADHVALVAASCAVDVFLLLSFALQGPREPWAWIVAISVILASVLGNCILLVGSRTLRVRPSAYYAASTLMSASAACCAAIDKTSELRGQSDIIADFAPFVVAAVMLLGSALLTLVLAKPDVRSRVSERAGAAGGVALTAAAAIVAASTVAHLGEGIGTRLALGTPFSSFPLSLSPLVAVLVALGLALVLRRRGELSRSGNLAIAAIPAALVLLGMDLGVSIALLVGIFFLLKGKERGNSATAYALFGVFAACVAMTLSPNVNGAVEAFWSSMANVDGGGRAYEAIKLIATSGMTVDMAGDVSGIRAEYGTLSLLANTLGMPATTALAAMCVSSALGYRVHRRRFARSRHSFALPACATLLCVAYVAVLTGLGLAPGYAPLPFVAFSEYSMAGYLVVVIAACASDPTASNATDPANGAASNTAIVLSEARENAKWPRFALAMLMVAVCCAGLHAGCGALKAGRDHAAIESLLITYAEEEGNDDISGNALARYATGTADTCSTIAPAADPSSDDGILVRLESRYQGGVIAERDYRMVFPDSDVSADMLWSAQRWLVNAEVYPSAECEYAISELLDSSEFESAVERALGGSDGAGAARMMIHPGFESASERVREEGGLTRVSAPSLKANKSIPFRAWGAVDVWLRSGKVMTLDCAFDWGGTGLNASSNGIVSISEPGQS